MYLFPDPYNATNSYDSDLVPMLCHSGSETGQLRNVLMTPMIQ